MADEVCDSWEEMLDNRVMEKKLESLNLSSNRKTEQATGNGRFKVLKRPNHPNNVPPSQATADSSANCSLNVNSEPFVPTASSKGPQITFEEENMRTQFKPSIKILKREKTKPSKEEIEAEKERARQATKSYEERAADYAKARERILGSASDSPPSSAGGDSSSTSSTDNNTRPNSKGSSNGHGNRSGNRPAVDLQKSGPDVPVVRLPQAPDGSRGFRR